MRVSGIYKIVNVATHQIYIGSAVDISFRRYRHFSQLRLNKHRNKNLQSAYNKHGVDAFYFEVVELCEPDLLLEHEQKYINIFNPFYNVCIVANSWLGLSHSDKSLKQLSETQKSYFRVYGAHNKGIPFSEQAKKNMSLAHIGIPAWNKGIPRTDSEKRKISESMMGGKHWRAKSIIQKTLQGEFVKAWDCAQDIARELGINTKGVAFCCKGVYHRSHGFKWEYLTPKTGY